VRVGLYVRAWVAWHSHLTKIPLVYSVSYFNLEGVVALFGEAKPAKAPPWRRVCLRVEDNMVNGLFFCAKLTSCTWAIPHLCKQERKYRHRCGLWKQDPGGIPGGRLPMSGMKVRSVVVSGVTRGLS